MTGEAKAVVGNYLAALFLHVQRLLEGGRGAVVSVKTRHICGEDRRCMRTVHNLMMMLVERGLAAHHKRGVYLIRREAGEEVLKVLKRWMRRLKPKAVFKQPQKTHLQHGNRRQTGKRRSVLD